MSPDGVPPRDSRDIAMSLARIEGMLGARLPQMEAAIESNQLALTQHVRESDSRRGELHSRINSLKSSSDRFDERLADVEERQAGQLGRTAQLVAVIGGAVGLLSLLIPQLPQA